jgi:hypothetical protein
MKIVSFVMMTILTVSLGLWINSCSEPVSGGTGTETINTFAVLPDGTPAKGASVKLIDARWWIDSIHNEASPVLGNGYTDINGYCSIEIPKRKGQVNLQIDHCDKGLLLQLSSNALSDPDTVKLQSYASISGTSAAEGAAVTSAFLAGTSYKVDFKGNNTFSFETVPPGSFSLLCMNNTSTERKVISTTAFSLTAGVADTIRSCSATGHQLLIDNFESGIGPTSLGSIIPVLGWYALTDSLYYYWDFNEAAWKQGDPNVFGRTTITLDSIVDDNGHMLTYSTVLDPDPKALTANSLIGFSLKPLAGRGIDLREMTGITFKASGAGTIWVRCETEKLDNVYSGVSHYSCPVELTEEPQFYTIPVDSLRILPEIFKPEHYPWKTVASRVERIEFNFNIAANDRNKKLTLNLDDIYFEGISLSSLYADIRK